MNKLEVAIFVYRNLTNKSSHGRKITGNLSEDLYSQYKSKLEDFDLLVSYDDVKLSIEFNLPLEINSLFSMSMEDLLLAASRQVTPPKKFFLADIDYLYSSENDYIPEIVKNYFSVSKFVSILLKISDHAIPDIPKAIFLHGEKLELSLGYTKSDLSSLNGLESFIDEFVEAEIHKEQKSTIIKGVLIEMLKNNEIERLTISCLIKRFSEFLERVNANYQLYVSEFSFEKIKNKFESEKLELTIKLNKIISDMQNQLLAVPVALVVVGSQMEISTGLTIKNLALWVGALVFGFMMSLLIRNQGNSLEAIKFEIESQWKNIESKHKFVAERLSEHYAQLKNRFYSQKLFLMMISLVVSLSILASTVFLIFNSGSVSELKRFIQYGIYGGVGYIFSCALVKLLLWVDRFFKRKSMPAK